MKPGRNDRCPCGSGKKYKRCCIDKDHAGYTPADFKHVGDLMASSRSPEPHLKMVPSVVWNGYRWRAIWDTLWYRPIEETFHEFVLHVLRITLGKEWHDDQVNLESDRRHIVMRWLACFREWAEANRTEGNRSGDTWGAIPSGDVRALISLAYDVYCLQVANKLPDRLVKRLRNVDEFQGVRYEIAVAAIIARTGFDIDFLDEKMKSVEHCEFIATHQGSGERFGVEAKSRRRKGVLHQPGNFDYDKDIKGDVHRLYEKACSQRPAATPYLIFIDMNLPSTPDVPLNEKPWVKDINMMLDSRGAPSAENPDPFDALVLTNFSYYYGGNEGPSPEGECITIVSKYPEVPLAKPETMREVLGSLQRYSHVPKEV